MVCMFRFPISRPQIKAVACKVVSPRWPGYKFWRVRLLYLVFLLLTHLEIMRNGSTQNTAVFFQFLSQISACTYICPLQRSSRFTGIFHFICRPKYYEPFFRLPFHFYSDVSISVQTILIAAANHYCQLNLLNQPCSHEPATTAQLWQSTEAAGSTLVRNDRIFPSFPLSASGKIHLHSFKIKKSRSLFHETQQERMESGNTSSSEK